MQGGKAAGGSGSRGWRGSVGIDGPPNNGASRWGALRQHVAVEVASALGQGAGAEQQRAAEFLRQRIMVEILGQPLRPGWETTDEEVLAAIRERCGLPTPVATSIPASAASTAASTPISSPLPRVGLGGFASVLAGVPAPACAVNGNGATSGVDAPGKGANGPEQPSGMDTAPAGGEPPAAQI